MNRYALALTAVFLSSLLPATADLTIPSDGSDGAFNPSTSVEIDLGLATTATWDAKGSGYGVYDPEKWAVVFKFTSVNIPNGVKVTFKNHPTYAPVVWLVQGNVSIAGELNLNGKDGSNETVPKLTPAEPGPGGFRGGARGPSGPGFGLGPGGGGPDRYYAYGYYREAYGNPQIIPLIGGSGAASVAFLGNSGSGGGGAIMIASGGSVFIDGLAVALGGFVDGGGGYAAGSGGAIKIIANEVKGKGEIICGGNGRMNGRIRVEAGSLDTGIRTTPETIAYPPANPPILWPAANAPTARVVSVDAVNAPSDPKAPLVAAADIAIQNSNEVSIIIETTNFPIEGAVQLFVTEKFGGRSTYGATRVDGDITSSRWRVQTKLPQGFVTLQARATQP
jgi:hypothetical protein